MQTQGKSGGGDVSKQDQEENKRRAAEARDAHEAKEPASWDRR